MKNFLFFDLKKKRKEKEEEEEKNRTSLRYISSEI